MDQHPSRVVHHRSGGRRRGISQSSVRSETPGHSRMLIAFTLAVGITLVGVATIAYHYGHPSDDEWLSEIFQNQGSPSSQPHASFAHTLSSRPSALHARYLESRRPRLKNVAFQSQASQSSENTVNPSPASRAVDGDSLCYWSDDMTSTASESHPWWETDLLDDHLIEKICVSLASDLNYYINSFKLEIFSSREAVGASVWTQSFRGGGADRMCFDVVDSSFRSTSDQPHHVMGRKVRLTSLAPSTLSLCEVEVYGEAEFDPCELGVHNCNQHAICVAEGSSGDYSCRCKDGFTGDGFGCQASDPCTASVHTCHPFASCVIDQAAPTGYSCVCRDGFVGDGRVCTYQWEQQEEEEEVTNPCSTASTHSCHGDHSKCVVTPDPAAGTPYTCVCDDGYSGDGHQCERINPCLSASGNTCHQHSTCTFTPLTELGYRCECNSGFVGDGFSCSAVDPCASGSNDCHEHALCIRRGGEEYSCICKGGYLGNGRVCLPHDRCKLGTHTCPAKTECVTTGPGTYKCQCPDGYEAEHRHGKNQMYDTYDNYPHLDPQHEAFGEGSGDRTVVVGCSVEDHCVAGTHNCHRAASCVYEPSTAAGFSCVCHEGYSGNGRSCALQDPCVAGVHDCHSNALCVTDSNRQPNGYSCRCLEGYAGDGVACVPVNKCQTGHHSCHPKAECNFQPPNHYDCTCLQGYQGDGFDSCELVDPCESGEHNCHENAECHVSGEEGEHDFSCSCKEGYDGDGVHQCVGENPCDKQHEVGNRPCHHHAHCINLGFGPEATYKCECQAGWRGDGHFCIPEFTPHNKDPQFDYCVEGLHDCHPNADCVMDEVSGYFQCECKLGYEGDGRTDCSIKDPCLSNSDDCDENAFCISHFAHTDLEVVSPDDDGYSCLCAPGYQGDGRVCHIMDPCVAGTHDCDDNAVCTPTPAADGGDLYRCSCKKGYTGDGKLCRKFNFCETGAHCCHPHATCYYEPHSTGEHYSCRCNRGYSGDGFSCVLENPCVADVGHECHRQADCVFDHNTRRYSCSCRSGYAGDGRSCELRDPCQADEHLCNTQADCVTRPELEEGYQCVCKQGYWGNGRECQVDDMCATNEHDCHPHATCHYRGFRQFECTCSSGYVGDGKHCSVADPCTSGLNDCHQDAHCSTLWGEDGGLPSYDCTCKRGFLGNGRQCMPADYCVLGWDDCHKDARCIYQTIGKYSCKCKAGFTGDGVSSCKPEDACDAHNNRGHCHEHASCVIDASAQSGYRCECDYGFTGDGVASCHNINPCATGRHVCHVNAECSWDGASESYDCTCLMGYEGDGRRACRLKREDNGSAAHAPSTPDPPALQHMSGDMISVMWDRASREEHVKKYILRIDTTSEIECGRETFTVLTVDEGLHTFQVGACNDKGCSWSHVIEQYVHSTVREYTAPLFAF